MSTSNGPKNNNYCRTCGRETTRGALCLFGNTCMRAAGASAHLRLPCSPEGPARKAFSSNLLI